VGGRFRLVPIGGVLVTALVLSGLAFDVRWALSRPGFEDAMAAALAPAPVSEPAGGRIGLYHTLGEPHVVGEAVFFRHPAGGGIFDDAGIAYVPDGAITPAEGAFESLRLVSIEGRWYRWWSSW
jgi:hypothetical protein